MSALAPFHPLVQRWFTERLGEPSEPQVRGWPEILRGRDVLIAAPTGSGKTLSAFLACVDGLMRDALQGGLTDQTRILYVSPLKALGNDVQKNLLQPLAQLRELALAQGLSPQEIRVGVRSGDTKSSERAAMLKRPPHILITTPESLYLLLTAGQSRELLRGVQTVVVDELHALARDKRGSHFTLSLERLKALTHQRPQLVGLSATSKPLDALGAFLTGAPTPAAAPLSVVHVGHVRPWQLTVETPDAELSAVATHELWGQVYDRLVALTTEHRTLLVFTNTRKLAERVAHDLGERLGHDKVAAHHGSMARELRLAAEERLKAGQLQVMVATASLELGIDIGAVDLVCQLGSPRSIAVMLQRIGRAGHYKGGISKGILFAMTQDELVECAALLWSIHQRELDAVRIPQKPLDVLAQQLVAACACEDWDEAALFDLVRRADPYKTLTQQELESVLHMLSEGVSTQRGRSRVHLHRDRVNGKLRARKGARITALTNAGAIPDTFNYPVIAEPEEKTVGTLDEDFAVESMAGDVFLLGSTSWRIQRVSAGTVRVVDAKGQPPSVPFWRGEAPSRTDELSLKVSALREAVVRRPDADRFLTQELGLAPPIADFLSRYLRATEQALGTIPSHSTVVAERFFDEAGGMQLIVHAPFGGRINRAWGLALRKRFCRTFDFELQAAATDDGIILSLGEQHSFPLADVFDFLSPNTVEEVLTQAVLQTPLFGTRFRWNATRALAMTRFSMGRKVPPPLQRARSDDLLASVFPAQAGCQDNHGGGDLELPDHPLVFQTMDDCLREAMDVDGLKAVLAAIKSGAIRTVAVERPEPSPLAHALLNSNPYTYLDDAPLEERRARAVSVRRSLPAGDAAAFGALDASAIAQVVADAQPLVRDAEELHDALLQLIVAPAELFPTELLAPLLEQRRAAVLHVPAPLTPGPSAPLGTGYVEGLGVSGGGRRLVAAERVPHAQALFPDVPLAPALSPLPGDKPIAREVAAVALVRGAMDVLGPTTVPELSARVLLPQSEVLQALHTLESEGQVLRGRFRPEADGTVTEWCDRRLLQRIHGLTVGRLRREIEPLSAQDFMRFLFRWHHLDAGDGLRGKGGLSKAVALLQGFEAPAAAWEQVLLPSRMHYAPELLEKACWSGELAWGRLTERARPSVGPRRGAELLGEDAPPRRGAAPSRNAIISFMRREDLDWLLCAARPTAPLADGPRFPEDLSRPARDVADALERRGACFFLDLVSATRRLPAEVEDALWELLARGLVTADAVENLRVLQSPKLRKRQKATARGGPGRWSLVLPAEPLAPELVHERLARLYLQRYGILWRDLVVREPLAPSWRELLFVYRRLEARGELRGGRFVAGFAGEQFALPEAVDVARSVRRAPKAGHRVHVSAVDPLNLTGVVTPGARVPAVLGNVVVYVDGVPETPTNAQGEVALRGA